MFRYYLRLALHSLRKNVALTLLIIVAIAFGVGASMTALTVLRAMSGDPIPQKSSQLFAVQIDNRGPADPITVNSDSLDDMLSYHDAVGLMHGHGAAHQTALYLTRLALRPADPKTKASNQWVRVTYSDFFSMFDVPFKYGRAWSASEDEARVPVTVITERMNDTLFGGGNSVGKVINLAGESYTIVGVLKHWTPIPHFYDLNVSPFRMREDLFIPFTVAIGKKFGPVGRVSCAAEHKPGWQNFIDSECTWVQFWVELPSAAAVRQYADFLNNYSDDQRRGGRFNWPPRTKLRDVKEWLVYRHVVANEVGILMLVALGFLMVCLMNAAGLMLARVMHNSTHIGLRRALGATRRAIFAQCLIEAGVVGAAGGLLGLLLTFAGLFTARAFVSEEFRLLTQLDYAMTATTVTFAIIVALLAGLYPTWRATHVQPAWHLKAQ